MEVNFTQSSNKQVKAMGRMLLICVGTLALFGCSGECDHYLAISQDKQRMAVLKAWAEASVFQRSFDASDFVSPAGFVGPGWRQFTHESGVIVPAGYRDHLGSKLSVRLLGVDSAAVDGVFLGARSYAGLVVARRSIDELLDRKLLVMGSHEMHGNQNDVIAVICRKDF